MPGSMRGPSDRGCFSGPGENGGGTEERVPCLTRESICACTRTSRAVCPHLGPLRGFPSCSPGRSSRSRKTSSGNPCTWLMQSITETGEGSGRFTDTPDPRNMFDRGRGWARGRSSQASRRRARGTARGCSPISISRWRGYPPGQIRKRSTGKHCTNPESPFCSTPCMPWTAHIESWIQTFRSTLPDGGESKMSLNPQSLRPDPPGEPA